MIERCATFGTGRSLTGVVTDPATEASRQRPAVVLLNAGLIHRVGPNRLHVRLARRLADAGFLSMRLDLSGRGDSDTRSDTLSFSESGIVETQEAMDYLSAASGVRHFVLMGICSGATTAGDVAYLDRRVVGAVIIEGAAYPTPRFRTRYYRKRLMRAETWRNTILGINGPGRRLRRALGLPLPAAPEEDMSRGAIMAPVTAAVVAPALREMAGRGVEFLAIFSGSTKDYNYVGQLRDAFSMVDLGGRLDEAYFPQADHTFTRRRDQEQLIDRISSWVTARFLAGVSTDHDRAGDQESLTEEALI